MDKIRTAVIGIGIQGENHIKAYISHPLVELVGVCDINEKRLNEITRRYNIKNSFQDYNEMLENLELDLVSVATPDFLHLDPVLSVLDNGINVLVEKPLALRFEDAKKMVDKARDKGVRLFVNFSNRFNPPFAVLKNKVESGEFGKVLYSYVRLSDTIYVPTKMLSWSSKTSVVYFLMSHTADLVRWIYNNEVSSVKAYAHFEVLKNLGIDTPDYVIAFLTFNNGSTALLESSWILPESYPSIVDFRSEFIGTKSTAFIDTTFQMIEYAAEKYTFPRTYGASILNDRFFGFVKESIHNIVDSLLNKASPYTSEEDGLANIRILNAIEESYKKNKEIILK